MKVNVRNRCFLCLLLRLLFANFHRCLLQGIHGPVGPVGEQGPGGPPGQIGAPGPMGVVGKTGPVVSAERRDWNDRNCLFIFQVEEGITN